MNAIHRAIEHRSPNPSSAEPQISSALLGNELTIGSGFQARSFRAIELDAAMDPLVMVDHYVMTEPTFGVHPHAGMSAVSLLFQDSSGRFHNQDSLGNDFDLHPGDLYWLKAGSGALHDEAPRPGSRIHGLQVFVNLPQRSRHDTPTSLLVRRSEMPVIVDEDFRVHVVLGHSNGVPGVSAPDSSMTILDGRVSREGTFTHDLNSGRHAWIHAIEGELTVSVGGAVHRLTEGEALTVSNPRDADAASVQVQSHGHSHSHFALFDAQPLEETYVQQGPFVMGSQSEIDAAQAAYAAGQFGAVA